MSETVVATGHSGNLQQINEKESFEGNIKRTYLKVTSYLYEEALLLLRQEVQEPGVYSAIIEAIASKSGCVQYEQKEFLLCAFFKIRIHTSCFE